MKYDAQGIVETVHLTQSQRRSYAGDKSIILPSFHACHYVLTDLATAILP